MEMRKPDRIDALRLIMKQVLNNFQVAEHDKDSLLSSIDDKAFYDLEDSCQYQAALKEGCTLLVTFNKRDFDLSDGSSVKVMTPQDFLCCQSSRHLQL